MFKYPSGSLGFWWHPPSEKLPIKSSNRPLKGKCCPHKTPAQPEKVDNRLLQFLIVWAQKLSLVGLTLHHFSITIIKNFWGWWEAPQTSSAVIIVQSCMHFMFGHFSSTPSYLKFCGEHFWQSKKVNRIWVTICSCTWPWDRFSWINQIFYWPVKFGEYIDWHLMSPPEKKEHAWSQF